MKKLRIFVSSVQKELEIERVAVAGWVSSDARLAEMCDVILFEKEPLSGKRISKPYLNHLRLMDQRGSGIGRMKTAMLNHGLDEPVYDLVEGYFRVTLNGPGDNLERLITPAGSTSGFPPAVEEQLSDRQRDILTRLAEGQQINSARCMSLYGISRQAINADFSKLLGFEVIKRVGAGRRTHYVLSNDE